MCYGNIKCRAICTAVFMVLLTFRHLGVIFKISIGRFSFYVVYDYVLYFELLYFLSVYCIVLKRYYNTSMSNDGTFLFLRTFEYRIFTYGRVRCDYYTVYLFALLCVE